MKTVEIVSPDFHANPTSTLDKIKGPILRVHLPIMGQVALCTTHDTCSALLKDHETFVRDPANAGKMTQARILKLLPRTLSLLALMLGHDDPEHRRLRGLVDTAFQRRSIEAIVPIITDGTASKLSC